ncbi:MAG: zinc ribbon domain-containing protein [Oscillospiraceae bacterium]
MFCRVCGKEIGNDSVFCRYCGSRTMFPVISAVKPVDCQENIDDKTNGWLVFLSILVPPVGIILGVKYKKKGRKKSGSTYLYFGVVFAVITFGIICTLLILYGILSFFHAKMTY